MDLSSPAGICTLLLALVAATIVHEFGHLLAAGLLGVPVTRVAVGVGPVTWRRALHPDRELILRLLPVSVAIGVPARRDAAGRLRRPVAHDVCMAAGGPLASLAFFVALALLSGLALWPAGVADWMRCAGVLSAFLGLANLLPIPGLDGGHLALLAAAGCGLELSGRREAGLHRLGLQVAALLCVGLAAVGLLQLV